MTAEPAATEGGPVSGVAEEVRRERAEQGLPPHVVDIRALELVRRLIQEDDP
jgi:hypothetical protein